MRDLDRVFDALSRSSFRRRFRLGPRDQAYVSSRGLPTVLSHARELLRERLFPDAPRNDGRQTPYRGHPVFIAQHATTTCCRGCLSNWHGIAKGHDLSDAEQDYVMSVLLRWFREQDRLRRVRTSR
jgi:predicted Fe-S protein YdhL (DUF1289 family)